MNLRERHTRLRKGGWRLPRGKHKEAVTATEEEPTGGRRVARAKVEGLTTIMTILLILNWIPIENGSDDFIRETKNSKPRVNKASDL